MSNKRLVINNWQDKARSDSKKNKYAIVEELKNKRPMTKQAFATINLCLFIALSILHRHVRGY